jgi:hypothetical protein
MDVCVVSFKYRHEAKCRTIKKKTSMYEIQSTREYKKQKIPEGARNVFLSGTFRLPLESTVPFTLLVPESFPGVKVAWF